MPYVQSGHMLPLGPLAGGQLRSLPDLAAIIAVAYVLYVAAVVVYRLWFHPLAKFPGPPLLAATAMPYLYRSFVRGRFAWGVKDLHRKYGPIVRISPNRLAVDGSVGWTDVFMHKPGKGTPEFPKQPGFFGPESEKSLIAAPTREAHRRQRRQLAHAFSEAAMHEQEPLITFYIDLFIRSLSENSRGGEPVDMVRWLNYLTFDIVGDLAFGESFGSLAKSDYHPWIHNMLRGVRGNNLVFFFAEAGPLLAPLSFLDPDGLVKAYKENREFSNRKALARIDLGPEPAASAGGTVGVDGQPKMQVRRDFITYMMRANKDGEGGLTRDEMRVNADTLIIAGSETTSTNLSTLFFELARPRNRHYRDAVAAEVRGRFTSESEVSLISANSNNLPLLHACIEESLRIHPPAGQLPPRVSPGALINGQYVPKGTVITLFQLATFHNPDHFLEPETFRPERFLPADHPMHEPRFKAYDNMAVFKPFSAGPRDCIGKNLSYSEMRLVAARTLLRFDIELAEGMSESWLEDQNFFFVWEKSPLMLKLTERTDLELRG